MRNWVVLIKVDGYWREFTAQVAWTADRALAQVDVAGTFKVVPARSWKTRTWSR